MLEGFNFRIIWEYMPLYGQCFLATLWLSALSLLGAILVGIIACAMRLSKSRVIGGMAGTYILKASVPLRYWRSSTFSISAFRLLASCFQNGLPV